jgi:uncharacterized lipoprotein YajG
LLTVRLLIAAVILVTAACGGGQISNLPLAWKAADTSVKPSPTTAQALQTVPLAFGLRDTRADQTAVGAVEEDHYVIRTSDNVAQYASNRFGDILRNAGANLNDAPQAILETDLLEFRVDEGGTYKGLVRIRVTVRRTGFPDWARNYEGTSSRWGRSHSPDNMNEALSNALHEATTHMLQDEEFGRALLGSAISAPSAPPPPAG